MGIGIWHMKKETLKKLGYIAFAVLSTAAFAVLAGLFTDVESEWYTGLNKSVLQPPGAVFGIAWGILYVLLAASFAITLIKTEGKRDILFLLNLALLALWCYVFFELQNAVAGIIVLAVTFVESLILFKRTYDVSRLAAYLLIPFVLWLAFAMVLNYSIILLN